MNSAEQRAKVVRKFNREITTNIGTMQEAGLPYPGYFARMAHGEPDGYYAAARRLLARPGPQSTFFAMYEKGLLHLTVEHIVASGNYNDLFSPIEVREAKRRLGVVQQPADN